MLNSLGKLLTCFPVLVKLQNGLSGQISPLTGDPNQVELPTQLPGKIGPLDSFCKWEELLAVISAQVQAPAVCQDQRAFSEPQSPSMSLANPQLSNPTDFLVIPMR